MRRAVETTIFIFLNSTKQTKATISTNDQANWLWHYLVQRLKRVANPIDNGDGTTNDFVYFDTKLGVKFSFDPNTLVATILG